MVAPTSKTTSGSVFAEATMTSWAIRARLLRRRFGKPRWRSQTESAPVKGECVDPLSLQARWRRGTLRCPSGLLTLGLRDAGAMYPPEEERHHGTVGDGRSDGSAPDAEPRDQCGE